MDKPISVLCFGVVAFGLAAVLGCESPSVSTVATTSSGSSSSGKGGEGGGVGGAGGEAGGSGGMAGGGGMAGMGGAGGMAGAGGMGMGGGGPTCAKPGNTCGDCLFDQCNLAYCGCEDEPACFGIIDCIQACPPMDANCVSGCYSKNSAGFSEFTIASSCAGTLCAPSCPGSDQVKPCDLCLAQQCETQFETCLAKPECMALIDCLNPCMNDMMCQQQCGAMYPAAIPLVQNLFTCAGTGCPNACN